MIKPIQFNLQRQQWLHRWVLGGMAAIAGMALSIGLHLPVQAQIAPQAGGDTTLNIRSSQAFAQPAPNLDEFWDERHAAGDLAFEAAFVTAPANVNPGLGPLFNSSSCVACHFNNGRGLQEKGQRVVRVSQLDRAEKTPLPVRQVYADEIIAPSANTPPVLGMGTQVQEQGIYGYPPEAIVDVTWQEQPGTYGDGTSYTLRSPQTTLSHWDGSPLPEGVVISNRIAPGVFGLGLLEAVPEATILQAADPEDLNGDGISGRPNRVWDVVQQTDVLGRFGWKANAPDLLQQSASAYANDMGVTNPLFPAVDGTEDIDMDILEAATIYVQTLAVPSRTGLNDAQVQQGERLFADANCAACHLSTLRTGTHDIPALTHQTFHPYTDLLLHDMGTELADNRPDFQASGAEWRTPPLWGLGLVQTVLPYSTYLHDGRARTLEEAILWHGGEAEASKEAFRTMDTGDRDAIVAFLESL
ncbi:di-heme oxidoredictase family protein [Oscillatoria sp. CS-180]|nr:di-heme oxidoredictase family protein [Oscillatoria sp. CS-180]